jgi:putative transposase
MPRRRHKPEEIVAVRRKRQVDVLGSQGKSVAVAVRAIGMTEPRMTAGGRSLAG